MPWPKGKPRTQAPQTVALLDAAARAGITLGPLAAAVSFRVRMVKCARPECKKCPHGPYIYAVYRVGKKVKTKYIGKYFP